MFLSWLFVSERQNCATCAICICICVCDSEALARDMTYLIHQPDGDNSSLLFFGLDLVCIVGSESLAGLSRLSSVHFTRLRFTSIEIQIIDD